MAASTKKPSLSDAAFLQRTEERELPRSPSQWVSDGASDKPKGKEKTRRISLDISESMHHDLRVYCAQNRTDVATMVRRFLSRTLYRRSGTSD